jgi:hypothetical protein
MRDMSAFSEDDHLSNKNISTLIMMRLSEGAERGGAVGYLANCHSRLAVKESSSASDSLRESLVDCRKQVVSFLASALSEKDMFDENSTNSTSDLVAWLLERQCLNIAVLKEILDELEKEGALDSVCVDLVQQAMLHSESLSASVADDVSSALLLLVTLCKVDKRLARKFAQHPSFLVEKSKCTAKPPRLTMPLHFMTPQMQSSMRVQGAALEALTPLGRMLRVRALTDHYHRPYPRPYYHPYPRPRPRPYPYPYPYPYSCPTPTPSHPVGECRFPEPQEP